ncbi:tautomerase family protein [Rouxiella sp. Mn2063]|uniref:tautomerase family protein n=1 Tax=Rouxiella sp. Mn2063 TaxID=3395262 RepID=UPI003BC284C7
MPYVNIRVTREGVSAEQKRLLIEGTTDLLWQVLGKSPDRTFVVIDEVDTDNWGVGGEVLTAVRARGK